MSHALEVVDLWKSYVVGVRGCSVRVSVLRGVSFHVGEDERLGIVGAPGAGKRTLVHCIIGLRRADWGAIRRGDGSAALIVMDETALDGGDSAPVRHGPALIVVRDPAALAGRVDRQLVLHDGRIAHPDATAGAPRSAQRVAEHRG